MEIMYPCEMGYGTLRSRRQPGRVRFQQGTLKEAHSGSNRRGWYTIFSPRFTQHRAGASGEHPGWTRNSSGTFNVMRGEGRNDFRRNFWSQRVTQPWNSLPKEVKEAESLNMFKNGIDNLIFKRHLANVRP